jgi:hypothetical protein
MATRSVRFGDRGSYATLVSHWKKCIKLGCWSRLHLQSLAPTPVSRRIDVRQAAGRNNLPNLYTT